MAAAAAPGNNDPQLLLPRSAPVVLLAHGYIEFRFDLPHIRNALASEGLLILAMEYPESLSASYDAASSDTGIPIDTTAITNGLLETLRGERGVRPTLYGILGHSLECGTVDGTGDESWTPVCIAGGATLVTVIRARLSLHRINGRRGCPRCSSVGPTSSVRLRTFNLSTNRSYERNRIMNCPQGRKVPDIRRPLLYCTSSESHFVSSGVNGRYHMGVQSPLLDHGCRFFDHL